MVDVSLVPLVYIDVETTGFDPKKCRITEVAAIRVEQGEVVGKLVSFIRIDEPVPEVITKITGITDTDLAYAPLFEEIAPALQRILDGAVFVAHNAKFDYSFFQAEFNRIDKPFTSITLCTCEMARSLCPPSLPNHKLQTLIDHYKFDYTERHRAYDDAAVLPQLMTQLQIDAGEHIFRETAQRVAV